MLNQTLERSKYEVFVITDFELDQRDDFTREGVKFVLDGRKEFCKKLSSVMGLLKGSYICLLDDDDLYHENKLFRVLQIFSEYSDVVFIQNNMGIINASSTIVKERFYRNLEETYLGPFGVDSYNELKKLMKVKFGFNGSSISVRKEVITRNLKTLATMEGSIEAFLLLSSVSIGGKLFFERQILTDYRIHNDNNSVALLKMHRRLEMYTRHHSDWMCFTHVSIQSNNVWLNEVIDEQLSYLSLMAEIFNIENNKERVLALIPYFMRKYHLSLPLKSIILLASIISLLSLFFGRIIIDTASNLSWKVFR